MYLKLRLCGVQVWLLLEPYHRTCCGAARAAGAALALNQPFPPALDSTATALGDWPRDSGIAPAVSSRDLNRILVMPVLPWHSPSGNSRTTDLWDHSELGRSLNGEVLGRNLPSQRVPGILNSTQSSCEQKKCPKAKSNNNKIKFKKLKWNQFFKTSLVEFMTLNSLIVRWKQKVPSKKKLSVTNWPY